MSRSKDPLVPVGTEYHQGSMRDVLSKTDMTKWLDLFQHWRVTQVLHDEIMLETKDSIRTPDPKVDNLVDASNKMFMFLCGMNVQDYPVADQRKYLELLNKLKQALEDFGFGGRGDKK